LSSFVLSGQEKAGNGGKAGEAYVRGKIIRCFFNDFDGVFGASSWNSNGTTPPQISYSFSAFFLRIPEELIKNTSKRATALGE
jgi:hypothetical protein